MIAPSAPVLALADRVTCQQVGATYAHVLPVPVRDVVSFRGSFETGLDMAAGDELTQSLAVGLLDKGTLRRDRFALAEALEDRGAQVGFVSDGLRISYSGRCLSRDLPLVLSLVAEQLREPLFDADEFAKAKARSAAGFRRAMDNTGQQAAGLLARQLYSLAHPNHHPPIPDELAALDRLTVDEIRTFYHRAAGANAHHVALVGNVTAPLAHAAVAAAFGDWSAKPVAACFDADAHPRPAARVTHGMADKQNLDVRFGHALPLRRDDPDYLALYTAVFILGGNFSARLMQTVRDEQGLTYGIGARLMGVAMEHSGHFSVYVTLSQANLERGIAATRAEVERFVADGITADELATKQTTITGTYQVSLATTSGLAASLLVNAERGFPLDYLDRYPALVQALTADQVNEAIRRYLHPADLHTALAGTLPE